MRVMNEGHEFDPRPQRNLIHVGRKDVPGKNSDEFFRGIAKTKVIELITLCSGKCVSSNDD